MLHGGDPSSQTATVLGMGHYGGVPLAEGVPCPVCRVFADDACIDPRAGDPTRRPHLRRVGLALAGGLLDRFAGRNDDLLVAQIMVEIMPRRQTVERLWEVGPAVDDRVECYTYQVGQSLVGLIRGAITSLDGRTLELEPLTNQLRQLDRETAERVPRSPQPA